MAEIAAARIGFLLVPVEGQLHQRRGRGGGAGDIGQGAEEDQGESALLVFQAADFDHAHLPDEEFERGSRLATRIMVCR